VVLQIAERSGKAFSLSAAAPAWIVMPREAGFDGINAELPAAALRFFQSA